MEDWDETFQALMEQLRTYQPYIYQKVENHLLDSVVSTALVSEKGEGHKTQW